ncbi:class D sortase [Clostridium sp. D2Q-11]|uniref:Class D sortase n=1 Tax=Anaeromonas frigoriresistens TaxID=2683708 RepID=A0A942Z809_9FIRM|nr:class D sortase [Anaeromonas frigoriresistens]
MKLRILGIMLIVLGISFIMYPKLKFYYYTDKQKDILEQWQEDLSRIEVNNNIETNMIEDKKRNEYISKNIDGVLKIKKIDFNQPILIGATKSNLNISVAKMNNTAPMGQEGNYVIAGHNSRTYGSNFNRLDEVNIGDILELSNEKEKFKYIVYEKLIVSPDDVWVIEGDRNRKTITLITCDYSTDPSSRLIIKGEIK